MSTVIYKQLGAMQDLTLGTGQAVQTRNGKQVVVDKLSISYVFNNVADAVAGSDAILQVGLFVSTSGYWTPGDGGGANYLVVAGGTGTHDGGSYINCANGLQLQQGASLVTDVRTFGFAEAQSAVTNTLAFQAAIDFVSSALSRGTVELPAGTFSYNGVLVKQFVNIRGQGSVNTTLELETDNSTGFGCLAVVTNSFADQVSYGVFKGFAIIPKNPSALLPTNQVMWNAIGFSRWTTEDLFIGWCGGVIGIKADGATPASLGGPAQWYNGFRDIFVERPASWPTGGTGWLLGDTDIAKEQITTWTIVGGRTSGADSGVGLNMQGGNTINWLGHTFESCDVLVGSPAGTRGCESITFSPAYFEGTGTNLFTIYPNAEHTSIFGQFITGYTFTDTGTKTTIFSATTNKQQCGAAGAQSWQVDIENGNNSRPTFRGSTFPAIDLINSNGDDLTLVNDFNTSSSQYAFRLLYNNVTQSLLNVGIDFLASGVDNTLNIGTGALRMKTIYAATGTIDTSDERTKTELLPIDEAEKLVAVELKGQLKKFKFLDAVEEKGDNARIHFGVGAQTVKATFEKHGLVAEDYAMLCYDEWEDSYREITATEDKEAYQILEYKAGNRYGVRYNELLAFIIAAL